MLQEIVNIIVFAVTLCVLLWDVVYLTFDAMMGRAIPTMEKVIGVVTATLLVAQYSLAVIL